MEDRLRKFAKVVEAKGVTAAAREMHISQPALSTSLHKLERELKTPLFRKAGRGLEVTAAGWKVYQTAVAVRAQLQDLTVAVAALGNQKPRFRLGMIDSLAELLCIKGTLLQELEQSANISLDVNNSAYLQIAVGEGRLDLVLVAGKPSRLAAALQATLVGVEPLVLVTHPARLAKLLPQVNQGRIPDFLAYNPASNTFRLVASHLAAHKLQPAAVFYSTSPEVILQLVRANRGVAALPLQMIAQQLRAGNLCIAPVRSPLVGRPIVAIRQSGRNSSVSESRCLEFAAQALVRLNNTAAAIVQAQAT
ncbi:MAG: LysR family transcriptional regulator [Candidatus Saccharimonadales bacterium]